MCGSVGTREDVQGLVRHGVVRHGKARANKNRAGRELITVGEGKATTENPKARPAIKTSRHNTRGSQDAGI